MNLYLIEAYAATNMPNRFLVDTNYPIDKLFFCVRADIKASPMSHENVSRDTAIHIYGKCQRLRNLHAKNWRNQLGQGHEYGYLQIFTDNQRA
jgi:hypothetical protein